MSEAEVPWSYNNKNRYGCYSFCCCSVFLCRFSIKIKLRLVIDGLIIIDFLLFLCHYRNFFSPNVTIMHVITSLLKVNVSSCFCRHVIRSRAIYLCKVNCRSVLLIGMVVLVFNTCFILLLVLLFACVI